MKIVPFDPNWVAWGASNGTLLGTYSGGSNSALGGDVTGDPGDLSVVGMRRQVSLASNLTPVTIGDVLTIVSSSPAVAQFSSPSNSTLFETKNEGGNPTVFAHGNTGATETIDPTDGNVHTLTLDSNCTFTINPPAGTAATLELWLTQDGTGGRTITWPGSTTVQGTLDTTASTTSRVVLDTVTAGTAWIATVVGAGGGSVSYGSNAMSVGATNQGGVSTDASRSDHRHQGLLSITSSSSNTLDRPTVNLRAGANVGLTASDTDGNGVFDTITISSTAAGGTGGAPDNSSLVQEKDVQLISDYVSGYDTSAGASRGFPAGFLHGGRQGTYIFEDCYVDISGLTSGAPWLAGGMGVSLSSGATSVQPGEVNHPGVLELQTSTSTSGRAAIQTIAASSSILLGGGKVRFGAWIKIPTLSVLANRFEIDCGFTDTAIRSTTVDGVLITYRDDIVSGNWQGITRSNSTESTLDFGTAVDTNWHLVEFEVNAGGSSVEFFLDRVSKGTITTNIPTGTGRETRMNPCTILKSAGTASRSIYLDAYYYHYDFTTAR